jgi:xylulokinase
MGLDAKVIRAGQANMFLSETFCEAFTNVTGAHIELFNTDGSQGAARGAGVGIGYYSSLESAFNSLECLKQYSPDKAKQDEHKEAYSRWKKVLEHQLS